MSLYVDITKNFSDFRLNVQLSCGKEVLALLGASGSGKSVTLKCIAGIEKPDKGQIVINGKTVFDSSKKINLSPQKRKTGYLFKNYALFPNMTVWENICCVAAKENRQKITQNMINTLFLENVKSLFPGQLSGGQQQRVALARILVSNPDIIMLDEPFSSLDSYLKWNLEQEMLSVLETFQGAALFVSHDRNEVYRFSDRIAVMDNGIVEAEGHKEEIFRAPQTVAAAMLTGCKNICRAEKIDEYHVYALDWGIIIKTARTVPDGIKHIGLHAHHLERVDAENAENIDAESAENNCYKCDIHKIIEEPLERIVLFTFNKELSNEGEKLSNEGEKLSIKSKELSTEDKDLKNKALVRYEAPKGQWYGEAGCFALRIPPDAVILIK